MTNQDVINLCESLSHLSGIAISYEMDKFIKNNYSKGNSDGKFYTVCIKGNDFKYGRYKIDPYNMVWRTTSFDEFYGGGIVD